MILIAFLYFKGVYFKGLYFKR